MFLLLTGIVLALVLLGKWVREKDWQMDLEWGFLISSCSVRMH